MQGNGSIERHEVTVEVVVRSDGTNSTRNRDTSRSRRGEGISQISRQCIDNLIFKLIYVILIFKKEARTFLVARLVALEAVILKVPEEMEVSNLKLEGVKVRSSGDVMVSVRGLDGSGASVTKME